MSPAPDKCIANNPAAIQAATFLRALVIKKLVNEPPGAPIIK